MKSIEQILDESAIQEGYKSIDEAYFDSETRYLHPIIKRAMIEHAKQCCDEQISDWIVINSERDLPTDKEVCYFYAEGGKYYNTVPCNLMFLMSTYNFLKGSDKPVTHYKIIQKPNTPNVTTK